MIVADFMTPDPVTVGPSDSLETALSAMDEYGIRHLPVVDEGHLEGVLNHRDLVGMAGWGLLGPDEEDDTRPRWVEQVMKTDVVTVSPDDQVVAAAVEVTSRGVGCLPVIEDGKLLGIVSEMDLVRLVSRSEAPDGTVLTIGAPRAIAVAPGATLAQLDELMTAKNVRHLPVERNAELIGLVADRDLRRALGAGLGPDAAADAFMTTGVVTIPADTTIKDAAATMFDRRVGALVIRCDEGFGIITTTDLVDHALGVLGG